MRRAVVAACAAFLVVAPVRSGATTYTVDATLDPDACAITGTVAIHLANTGAAALDDLALVLYPNRFAAPEPGLNDLNRPFVYPREEHVAGGIRIEALAVVRLPDDDPGTTTTRVTLESLGGWPDTLARVALAAPIPPGGEATVRVRFRTLLPERYGPFGIAEGRVTALDGWFPRLAARDETGAWQPAQPAEPAAARIRLAAPSEATLLLGSTIVPAGHPGVVEVEVPAGTRPTLLASSDYRLHAETIEGVAVRLLELPPRRALVYPRRPTHARVVREALGRILAAAPVRPTALLVAEAPLRLELTGPAAPGVVVVSDRVLRVHRLLRPFHERELAEAVYGATLRPHVAAREAPADVPWVLEGVAATLADRHLAAAHARERSVGDWIDLFNVFAIVDRFESAPKIPFARVFFPAGPQADELRDGYEGFARARPPGRTIMGKVEQVVGAEKRAAIVDAYLAGEASFAATAAAVHGESLDWLFAQWVAPYPRLDYALEARLNRKVADGYHHRLWVRRESSRPIREPVTLAVRGADARQARLVWNDEREEAEFAVVTRWRARRAELDPDRRLLQETRANDARPPYLQIVLDSADVTVTSSEFGVSGLFVARPRYDYTKDLGLIAFFSDRATGIHVGPRLHFGAQNDPTSYRHNLHAFYTLASLRADFRDDSRPARRTDGTLAGLGLRYDYGDEFAFDNPTGTNKIRLFGDWYSEELGGDHDYLDWGVRVSAVRPLLTARTLLAVQILNAFSTPIDGRVPNQGRYSLGGDLAIRGIPVEERLGENVALVRAELRQTVYPDVYLNFMDLAVLRHGQIRLFVDAGRVEDRRSSLYRVADFAVGVGIGAAAVYDFMGFYPALAYVALAQRVDRFDGVDNGVQFLFGTRQAF